MFAVFGCVPIPHLNIMMHISHARTRKKKHGARIRGSYNRKLEKRPTVKEEVTNKNTDKQTNDDELIY